MILNMIGQGGKPLVITETYDTNGGIIYSIDTKKTPIQLQAKTIAPATSSQTINPDTGYDGFSQIIVETYANGNNLEYGITDGTQPLIGVGQIGSMVI